MNPPSKLPEIEEAVPLLATLPPAFRQDVGVIGKSFDANAIALFPKHYENFIFSTRIEFLRGERAGLVLRADASGNAGLCAVADRRMGRVELKLLGGASYIDARAWRPADSVEMKVVANQESIELYLDNRLYLHQVRHREVSGQIGWFVEKAEARFTEPALRIFRS